jgi:hypothetical protein
MLPLHLLASLYHQRRRYDVCPGEKRDCAAVEDFLAELSKNLPLPEGKGDAKTGKVIDDTILVIKNLHAGSKMRGRPARRHQRIYRAFVGEAL